MDNKFVDQLKETALFMTALVAEDPPTMIEMFSATSDLIYPTSSTIDTSKIDIGNHANIITSYIG